MLITCLGAVLYRDLVEPSSHFIFSFASRLFQRNIPKKIFACDQIPAAARPKQFRGNLESCRRMCVTVPAETACWRCSRYLGGPAGKKVALFMITLEQFIRRSHVIMARILSSRSPLSLSRHCSDRCCCCSERDGDLLEKVVTAGGSSSPDRMARLPLLSVWDLGTAGCEKKK